MERLTDNNCGEYWLGSRNEGKAINKLGKLEDIEEEIGISLEVLFKALKKGIMINRNGILRNLSGIELRYNSYFECWFFEYGMGTAKVKLKDYGKTWALNSEELEND